MTRIVLYHHLGLGDHFVCNGLVNDVADRHEHVFLPYSRLHEETVACLYRDQVKVTVFPVDNDRQHAEVAAFAMRMNLPVVKVGFEQCVRERFDESFYEQLHVPFAYRFSRFRLPAEIPHEDEIFDALAPDGPYAIVHREASVGPYRLRIDTRLPIVEIRRRDSPHFANLLTYRRLLQRAAEIHCINSSVVHLANSIDTIGRRFYHDVRRRNFRLAPGWTTIPYRALELREGVARVRRVIGSWSTA